MWRPRPSLASTVRRSVQVCPSLPSLSTFSALRLYSRTFFELDAATTSPGFDVSAPAGQYLAARNARPRNPRWRCPFPPSSLAPLNAQGERNKRGRNDNSTVVLNLDDRLLLRIRISIFNADEPDDLNESPSRGPLAAGAARHVFVAFATVGK